MRFYNVEKTEVLSEAELHDKWISMLSNGEIDREIYADFQYFVNGCLVENKGSLRQMKQG